MTSLSVRGRTDLRALATREFTSDWLEITQDRVSDFGACTDDRQWIHVDPSRAAHGPFGGTVAHGFLSLSLITQFWEQTVAVDGFRLTVNYGLNRVRFPAPLLVGARVRAHFTVKSVDDVEGGVQVACSVTMESDTQVKPVCVAETLVRFYE